MTAILPLKQPLLHQRRERTEARVQGEAMIIIFPGIRYEKLDDDHWFEPVTHEVTKRT